MNKEENIYHTLPVIGVLLCFEFNKELMTLTATESRSTLILNMDNPKSIVGRVIRLNDVRFVVQKVNVSEIDKYNSEVKLNIVKQASPDNDKELNDNPPTTHIPTKPERDIDNPASKEYQLGVMRNFEDTISNDTRKRNANWVLVQKILTGHTSKGGSTSAYKHCRWLGVDPDGRSFYPTTEAKKMTKFKFGQEGFAWDESEKIARKVRYGHWDESEKIARKVRYGHWGENGKDRKNYNHFCFFETRNGTGSCFFKNFSLEKPCPFDKFKDMEKGGKIVQFQDIRTGEWIDRNPQAESYNPNREYRVKPEVDNGVAVVGYIGIGGFKEKQPEIEGFDLVEIDWSEGAGSIETPERGTKYICDLDHIQRLAGFYYKFGKHEFITPLRVVYTDKRRIHWAITSNETCNIALNPTHTAFTTEAKK